MSLALHIITHIRQSPCTYSPIPLHIFPNIPISYCVPNLSSLFVCLSAGLCSVLYYLVIPASCTRPRPVGLHLLFPFLLLYRVTFSISPGCLCCVLGVLMISSVLLIRRDVILRIIYCNHLKREGFNNNRPGPCCYQQVDQKREKCQYFT